MLSPVGTGLPSGMRANRPPTPATTPPAPPPPAIPRALIVLISPLRVCLLSEDREGAFPFLLPNWLSIRLVSVVSILAERTTEG